MELKERFDSVIMRHDLGRNEFEETKQQCVEIADDLAIDFLSWYNTDGKWITKHFDNKELLQIYKTEKGL